MLFEISKFLCNFVSLKVSFGTLPGNVIRSLRDLIWVSGDSVLMVYC